MRKFPLTKQHDAMQCGIACLQMICKHHGKKYSTVFLSSLCPESKEGVSLAAISKSATKIGLNNKCGLAEVEELNRENVPCILHWNQNHFVVLYKVKKGKTFYIADPGKGLVKYDFEEFKKHWISTKNNGEEKGIAMFLEPTPEFYTNNIAEDDTRDGRSFKFLFRYIRKYHKYFGQIVLGLLVGSLLQLILPFYGAQNEAYKMS
ncbi:cysteine peptidase family C39 domain-containing protein [Prevotella sp. HUN102]|uniref:cysteine peptidase family C39 domain-containing protein n=1 Tax=Prevotella sp. HUN102 TaxID=1392486 RepID=UPI00048DAC3B